MKKIHQELSSVFLVAFEKYVAIGGNLKEVFWFKSEKKKEKDQLKNTDF